MTLHIFGAIPAEPVGFRGYAGGNAIVDTNGCDDDGGPVAQWITRLTTDQKIPGSSPGRIAYFSAPPMFDCDSPSQARSNIKYNTDPSRVDQKTDTRSR